MNKQSHCHRQTVQLFYKRDKISLLGKEKYYCYNKVHYPWCIQISTYDHFNWLASYLFFFNFEIPMMNLTWCLMCCQSGHLGEWTGQLAGNSQGATTSQGGSGVHIQCQPTARHPHQKTQAGCKHVTRCCLLKKGNHQEWTVTLSSILSDWEVFTMLGFTTLMNK